MTEVVMADLVAMVVVVVVAAAQSLVRAALHRYRGGSWGGDGWGLDPEGQE